MNLGSQSAHLTVAGFSPDHGLSAELQRLAAYDTRVKLILRVLSDEEIAGIIGRAILVVLPYVEMHNSGAALLALSLNRPILVPSNPVNDALATEVGSEWVLRYDKVLAPEVLEHALLQVRDLPARPPDLSRRDWSLIGEQIAACYADALERAR